MAKREPDPAIQAAHGLGKADEPQRELPANVEAEQALLGLILNDNRAFDRVSAFLEADHFYERLHQKIFMIAGEMIGMGKTCSPVSVHGFIPSKVDGLKVDGQDATPMKYLARLAADAFGNPRDLGLAIHEEWLLRQEVSAITDRLDAIYQRRLLDPLSDSTLPDRIAALAGMRVRNERYRGPGQRYIDGMDAMRARGEVPGVPIGLEAIQRVISEPTFESGNYYGLLSSSSEGKTSMMLQIALHALSAGHPVLIQSYDQSAEQFVRQMIAQRFKIEARRQRFNDINTAEWIDAKDFATWLDRQPFDVIECTHESAAPLVTYAREFMRKFGNGKTPLIITDHVNAIEPEKRHERSDEGSKAAGTNGILKAAARSTGAAWLTLNQRNTKGMERENPRPIARDMYGGEGAKRAYDACFYLYRFLKFYNERVAIASKAADWTIINKVFPSDVREKKFDIAEIGAVKTRFGSPSITETMDFNARFTLLESIAPALDQDEMSFIKAMG